MKAGAFMNKDKLSEQSMELAILVTKLVKKLQSDKEYVISIQIGRSGTSIGANIREARYAQSRADFISKFQIALKEANETGYWLELLYKTDYIDKNTYNELSALCSSIRVALISSINTAKANINKRFSNGKATIM